jgi:hypothetical protein
MKTFDNYEIHGVHEFSDDGRKFCEQVPDDQAIFWTLYGHVDGEGVEAIGDFTTRPHAEELFQRITGIPYAESREVMAHISAMHAGPKLLADLKFTREWFTENGLVKDYYAICNYLDEAIAAATGRRV